LEWQGRGISRIQRNLWDPVDSGLARSLLTLYTVGATEPDKVTPEAQTMTTVPYRYKVLPNSNPQHPQGFAFITWHGECEWKEALPAMWHRECLSYEEAENEALAEIEDDKTHFIGDEWTFETRKLG
jgi:hypothetical protein